jgi:hypothetical protein
MEVISGGMCMSCQSSSVCISNGEPRPLHIYRFLWGLSVSAALSWPFKRGQGTND